MGLITIDSVYLAPGKEEGGGGDKNERQFEKSEQLSKANGGHLNL